MNQRADGTYVVSTTWVGSTSATSTGTTGQTCNKWSGDPGTTIPLGQPYAAAGGIWAGTGYGASNCGGTQPVICLEN